MVKRLNIPLDDSDFENAKAVKDNIDLTWEEFIREAADYLKQSD